MELEKHELEETAIFPFRYELVKRIMNVITTTIHYSYIQHIHNDTNREIIYEIARQNSEIVYEIIK